MEIRFHGAQRKRFQLVGIIGCLGIITGLILWSRSGEEDRPLPGGDAPLISIQPLGESGVDGEMCLIPASSNTVMIAARNQGQGFRGTATQPASDQRPSEAVRAELAQRKPVRMIQDPNPVFSAIALDLRNDEVVIQDENTWGINVYNRLDNTPPTAKMTEPKRTIRGEATNLEFNCGLYVDPANGDIYSVNNDTLNLLTVFNRDAKGNAAPKRVLAAPYFHGIAVDEERQEMFMSSQGGIVAVWKKTAQGNDPPVRFIKGNRTQLADPHGIALDSKRGLIFVTNWGTSEAIEIPSSGSIPWGDGRLWKAGWSQGGNTGARTIPGMGKIQPAAITVYPRDAIGDVIPLQVIQGPKTQLDWPVAIAVAAEHGELFIANSSGHSIAVFNIDANGNAAPVRVIRGPKSLINLPTGIAYDPKHDELWVTNYGNHAATVYKRTAAGDTPPVRVIRSAPLDAPIPMMGNPHVVVYDSKREQILVAQ